MRSESATSTIRARSTTRRPRRSRRIATDLGQLDILTASLEGLHDRLLGLPVDAVGLLLRRAPDGAIEKPDACRPAAACIEPACCGLTRARSSMLRPHLDLPVDTLRVPARDETGDGARPCARGSPPARWLFRLVDPGHARHPGGDEPARGDIDQIDPAQAVNPVSGFLLPDHMDEALEVFDAAGTPLGQLMHEPFGGGVMWEIAPGRTGPADAGPGFDLGAAAADPRPVAAGMVAADARERNGRARAAGDRVRAFGVPARDRHHALDRRYLRRTSAPNTSPDWSAAPSPSYAPRCALDIQDDLDELTFRGRGQRAARARRYEDLADAGLPGAPRRAHPQRRRAARVLRRRRLLTVPCRRQGGARRRLRRRPRPRPVRATTAPPGRCRTSKPIYASLRRRRGRTARPARAGGAPDAADAPAGRVHLTSGILPRKSAAACARLGAAGACRDGAVGARGPRAGRPGEDPAAEGLVVSERSTLDPTPIPRRRGRTIRSSRRRRRRCCPKARRIRKVHGRLQSGCRSARPIRRRAAHEVATTGPPEAKKSPESGEKTRAAYNAATDGELEPQALIEAREPHPTIAPTGIEFVWVPIGPSVVLNGQAGSKPRVTGRVRDIAVSPDGQRVYSATANGGVWYIG